MARSFNGSSDKLQRATGAQFTGPFTVAVRIKMASIGTNETVWSSAETSSASRFYNAYISTSGALIWTKRYGGASTAGTTNAISAGNWSTAVVGIDGSATQNMFCCLDGNWANSGTNTTTKTDPNNDREALGVLSKSADSFFFSGTLCEAYRMNTYWGQAEVEAFHAGYLPPDIDPTAIVVGGRILGRLSPEPEFMGGTAWTVTGASQADHDPSIITKRARRVYFVPAAPVGGTTPKGPLGHPLHGALAGPIG